jgi:spore germination protein
LKNRCWYIWRILVIGGLLVTCGCLQGFCQLAVKTDSRTPKLAERPKILAFYEEGWGGIYAGSLTRLREVRSQVDLVSPVWLGLKADGRVNWDKTNAAAVRFFTQNKLEFLALVTAGGNSSAILAKRVRRRRALRSIVAYVAKAEPGGICLDFEYINPALKDEFSSFVSELQAALAGRKLLVAVFPYVNWAEPTKEAYDYRRLGKICDGIIVMTYDQYRPKDPPGPIAAQSWVEENVTYLLKQIAPHKLWLGIAGYGYRWQKGKRRAVALPAWYCREQVGQRGGKATYQSKFGNDCLEYTENGVAYTIWWESARSLREKLALAVKKNLAGVALWRLGYEEREFWESIESF